MSKSNILPGLALVYSGFRYGSLGIIQDWVSPALVPVYAWLKTKPQNMSQRSVFSGVKNQCTILFDRILTSKRILLSGKTLK